MTSGHARRQLSAIAGYLRPQRLASNATRAFFAGVGVDGPVNVLERCGDGLAILVGHEVEAVAQKMDDAGLNRGVGKDCDNGFRKAFEAVDHSYENVFNAAGPQLIHDPQPELGALVLFEPKAENFLELR